MAQFTRKWDKVGMDRWAEALDGTGETLARLDKGLRL